MDEDRPADFPEKESHTDCAGREIEFGLSCRRMPLGWRVAAVERCESGPGYQFEAWSPNSPFLALGEVRKRIRQGLAVKYLAPGPVLQLTHERAIGRISWNEKRNEASLVVDGREILMADLERLLASHEGWRIELKLSDSNE